MHKLLLTTLRDRLRPRRDPFLENLALRQQLLVLEREKPKPVFRCRDRLYWVLRRRWWSGWRRPLRLVL
jgi:hypothetical protein